MVNSISSRTAAPGDYFYSRTASPITDGDRIVVPVGSYVQGSVTFSERSGKVKGRALLGLRLEKLTLPSGKTFQFTPVLSSVDAAGGGQKLDRDENRIRQGQDHQADARKVLFTAGTGAVVGAFVENGWEGAGIGAGIGGGVGLATVMLTRGREVSLPQGSSLDVVFDRPLRLE